LLLPNAVKLFFHLPGCFHHRNKKVENKPVGKIDGKSKEDISQHNAKLVKYETLNKHKVQCQVKCWLYGIEMKPAVTSSYLYCSQRVFPLSSLLFERIAQLLSYFVHQVSNALLNFFAFHEPGKNACPEMRTCFFFAKNGVKGHVEIISFQVHQTFVHFDFQRLLLFAQLPDRYVQCLNTANRFAHVSSLHPLPPVLMYE